MWGLARPMGRASPALLSDLSRDFVADPHQDIGQFGLRQGRAHGKIHRLETARIVAHHDEEGAPVVAFNKNTIDEPAVDGHINDQRVWSARCATDRHGNPYSPRR